MKYKRETSDFVNFKNLGRFNEGVMKTTNFSSPKHGAAPVETKKAVDNAAGVRQEKVTVVSGADGLKDYSVVCGSFGLKANAEGLKDFLDKEGYNATIAFNAETAMYRVIVNTFADRASAAQARDAFKAKYPSRKDFQGAWLLYRIY